MAEVLRILQMSSVANERCEWALAVLAANEHLLRMGSRSNQKTSPE